MLSNIGRKTLQNCFTKSAPSLSVVRHKAAYEGEGKTTVRVLNQEQDLGLLINSYATYGFRLNNGVTVLGPMAIFPRCVLAWSVRDSRDVHARSLRLFAMLAPRVDLLVIGLEAYEQATAARVLAAARACRLTAEVLPTDRACSTFNFLNTEGRSVAAALIPPVTLGISGDDALAMKLHYNNTRAAVL